MLLTGFDAPVEQALYLDRPLREHSLLQAIARVNRRFSHEWEGVAAEKHHGLVVDYRGVSRELEQALSSFDWPDVQDTMRELANIPCRIQLGTLRGDVSLAGIWTGSGLHVFAPPGECKGFGWAYARLYDFTLPIDARMRIMTTSTEPTYVNLRYGTSEALLRWNHRGGTTTEIIFDAHPFTYSIEVVPRRPFVTGSFDLTIALSEPEAQE